jgi:hypothetical protein
MDRYSIKDKIKIAKKLSTIRSEKHYRKIFDIIKDAGIVHTRNSNGAFILVKNIDDDTMDKIVAYYDINVKK